ncbi:flagellar motor switch protein FliN [Nocardioides seonyuensis]|uniref:Flagellar motor switch protein FliN n=1 Tax=Nocardioides seonyuensis TaxID=2518371 RepID=A0A4P7IER6_9ACTN|nr:flagellar motor switch protein FliN [Nocardioides seonyuensis]QBX55230.1 flagellar motor switch protein FliN [Nocardioides seonyuensis]
MTTTLPESVTSAAAEAVAAVLPAPTQLVAGAPVVGDAAAVAEYAGAAVAELLLPGAPRVAVLVGAELVEALAASPMGGLDLAAATQPALDAAAAALGASCGTAREVSLDQVGAEIGGSFALVPLLGGGTPAGALLVSDAATASAAAVESGGVPPVLQSPAMGSAQGMAASRGIEMLHGVDMEVTVELGRTHLTVRELLALSPGAVLELDRAAGSPADLLVNGRLIARGEVVVVDENFGLRVTEILDETAVG